MLRSLLILIVLLITAIPSTASTQGDLRYEPQVRLLLHGTKPLHSFANQKVGDDFMLWEVESIGLGFWVIEPNLLDRNLHLQAVIGPRLQGVHGWIELMGGINSSVDVTTVIDADTPPEYAVTPVIDLRWSLTPSRHLHLWGEGTVYTGALYTFFQADLPIWGKRELPLLKIGGELEAAKAYTGTSGFVGGGPHVIIPWAAPFATVISMQMRCSNNGTTSGCSSTELIGRLYLVFSFGS